jgi:3-phosphoshikimate 1-carboxyvinyltransferase
MGRVIAPLRAMGADIACLGPDGRLPVRVAGANLRGMRHDLPVPSAQVKSALLLAGLFAQGETEIHGGGASRDHTERLLAVMGAGPARLAGDGLCVRGGARPGSFAITVPGDPSSAAFFLVAAAMIPGSRVTVLDHALNEGRVGALAVLRRAGARVTVERPRGRHDGEMIADVTVEAAEVRPFAIAAQEIPTLVDEIPVLAVLATRAAGESVITGAAELRVKESDRLAMLAHDLGALGAQVRELPDGLRIEGPTALAGGTAQAPLILETAGDHRIAMAMAVAALGAGGHAALDDPACVAISYPDFFEVLDGLLDGPPAGR